MWRQVIWRLFTCRQTMLQLVIRWHRTKTRTRNILIKKTPRTQHIHAMLLYSQHYYQLIHFRRSSFFLKQVNCITSIVLIRLAIKYFSILLCMNIIQVQCLWFVFKKHYICSLPFCTVNEIFINNQLKSVVVHLEMCPCSFNYGFKIKK